jgi:hypothetical protein
MASSPHYCLLWLRKAGPDCGAKHTSASDWSNCAAESPTQRCRPISAEDQNRLAQRHHSSGHDSAGFGAAASPFKRLDLLCLPGAPSGGSNRATARSLNVCPYRATDFLHRRPRVSGPLKPTTIVMRGGRRLPNSRQFLRNKIAALDSATGCRYS